MRYFEFTVELQEKDITSSKVRLKDYSYDNSIEALCSYLFKNLTNGVTFLAYRMDDSGMKSMFAIDEKFREPKEAYDEIIGIINDVLDNKVTADKPVEITMLDFDTNMSEGKRRGYVPHWGKIYDQANIILYEDRDHITTGRCGFKINEMVAGACANGKDDEDHLFDASLKEELDRIKADKKGRKKGKTGDIMAFPAHYIISSRSQKAGSDITLRLMETLAEAGRLPSRRMELFADIDEELYKHSCYFEKFIENSYGCTIVIDMTARFGVDPTKYQLTCDYLCKVIRQHKNDNLFVFLYNPDNPGFTYYLIPQIEKFMYLVKIREGKGNSDDAEKYLKFLIENSDFSKYSGQTDEFMKTMPDKSFTQTDVIQAYEDFESWCMRKYFLKSYDLEADEGFYLDRDTDNLSASEKLDKMIGLKVVKNQIDKILLANKAERQRVKLGGRGRAMHMIFEGNPGTAKTTVAELFAQIAKEHGILKSGIFVERSGLELSGLISSYAIHQAFDEAKGGVLFIDEAYALCGSGAVTTLIRELEMKRNEVIVIFAGYGDRMKNFIEQNEGLKSRIPYTVHFPDYSPDELLQIYDYILDQDGYTATSGARSAAREIFGKAVKIKNFGNGRYARTLAEKSTLNMSVRLAKKYKDKDIPVSELYKVIKDDVFNPDDTIVNCNNGERRRGKVEAQKTARERLADMIGLESAKKLIDSAIATFKMQKRLLKRGVVLDNNTMHMVFTGNPGTAKTTTARLMAEILKEEGILSSGVFVEAGRADLVGQFVGHTAPKVRKKFDEANGGVLFIDEAYSLNDGSDHGSFGDEAINTIVQEMDNRRGDMIVVFAGYPDEMKSFIERNPGMSSRIGYRVNFEDYSVEELCEITRYQVEAKHLHITDDAIEKLIPIYEKARLNRTFGNGRYVRRAVELAISNLAVRLDKIDDKDLTDEILMTIEAEDIAAPELDPESTKQARRIGFAA